MKFIFIFLTVPRGCPVICGQLKTDFPIPAALFVLYSTVYILWPQFPRYSSLPALSAMLSVVNIPLQPPPTPPPPPSLLPPPLFFYPATGS